MTMTQEGVAFYAFWCVPDEISPTGSRRFSHPNAEESSAELSMSHKDSLSRS